MKNTEGMLKENSLKGKVVIVTGGGTGLGKSMSAYFLKLGASVVITSRNMEVLNNTASELEKEIGGCILPLSCDVRDEVQVENVLKQTVEKFGEFHVLVNNAAGNFASPTEKLSYKAFNTIVDIVLKGTSNFTLAAGKHWIAQKVGGTVLNIVTTYAFTGSGYVVPSACAKAGVLALTRSLAVEWAKYNIRSNAIAPGPFPTEGAWSRLLPGELTEQFNPVRRVPLGRVGELQELANLAAYLISDYSAYINGEVVVIDGGEWLKGAGQFNALENVPPKRWNELDKLRKKT
ncbi:MAG: SDR family oxidoreductase [Flavobacteriales bacterium]|nr:SDR family oxidoreductase [Flavobacteriales bacterium]